MKTKSKPIEIWCTLGPASLNKRVIERLTEARVTGFRINLSHTRFEDIEETVLLIKRHTSLPIGIDTEGPQVRTGIIKGGETLLKDHQIVVIGKEGTKGDNSAFSLRPASILSALQAGDLISIDFNSVLLNVIRTKKDCLEAKVICGGKIGSNKAVTIDRKIGLPILSAKDTEGLEILSKYQLKDIFLSFVHQGCDVKSVRKIVGPGVRIIAKIETSDALINLKEIIAVSDAILIDRGDLSREEPINKIPLLQKSIIKEANRQKKSVLVATNLLESMVKAKKPLRSEVNDIMNTLLDGASGLILAAETAIGKYPVECANMVKRMIKYYDIAKDGYSFKQLLKNDSFLLVEPHGGSLVERYQPNPDYKLINSLPKLVVDEFATIDSEQIGIGTYSPLTGFMTREELHSVLEQYRLPSGVAWTLPIILQVPRREQRRFRKNDKIALVFKQDKHIYATLEVKSIFSIDLHKVSQKLFGTRDDSHPGVRRLFEKGECLLGGDIELVKRRDSEYKEFEFTPRQARVIFENKEWSKIAGFHTRNAIHRAHEYLQLSALKKYNLDGLFIHPVIGPKKPHDFRPHVILESYQLMLDAIYPKGKVVLGAFSGYSHYAGPREAVFTALCRKNFGCNYFIIGRDHTGLGDFYESGASRKLFDKLGDIGITPIFFNTVYYCKRCQGYVEKCSHSQKNHYHISGTQARAMLLEGRQPPEWFLHKDVSNLIISKIKKGEEVFVK